MISSKNGAAAPIAACVGSTAIASDPSHALEGDRDALADADAHGGQRPALTGELELEGGGADEAGAAHSERVAERDGAAIGIDVRRLLGEAEVAQHGNALARESFVEL